MREILFRGKRTDGDGWVQGSYIECKMSWHRLHPHKAWIVTDARSNGGWFAITGRFPVVNDTVGQYTGLKDKAGRLIFEGDILAWDEKEWGGPHTEIVAWDYEQLSCRANDWREWCEIIGNIYDNPELLETESITQGAQDIPDRCRRCCEAGADHDIDEHGNLIYLCNGCRHYTPLPDKPTKPRRRWRWRKAHDTGTA